MKELILILTQFLAFVACGAECEALANAGRAARPVPNGLVSRVDHGVPVVKDPYDAPAGMIYLANESAFGRATFNTPLTEYAVGSGETNEELVRLRAELDAMAPEVPASRKFHYKKYDANDAKLAEEDNSDIRAIGAEFKQTDRAGTTVNDAMDNKGLATTVDVDEADETMPLDQLIQSAVDTLQARLLQTEINRAEAILTALDGSPTAKVWDSSADPDVDLKALLKEAADTNGVYPNTLFIGESAHTLRFSSLSASTAPAKGVRAGWTDEQLRDFLGIRNVVRFKESYYRVQKGKTLTLRLDAKVVAAYIDPMPSKNDPSNIKRFVSNATGGGRFAVHVNDTNAKFFIVTVEHYSKIAQTNALGAAQYNVSAS